MVQFSCGHYAKFLSVKISLFSQLTESPCSLSKCIRCTQWTKNITLRIKYYVKTLPAVISKQHLSFHLLYYISASTMTLLLININVHCTLYKVNEASSNFEIQRMSIESALLCDALRYERKKHKRVLDVPYRIHPFPFHSFSFHPNIKCTLAVFFKIQFTHLIKANKNIKICKNRDRRSCGT